MGDIQELLRYSHIIIDEVHERDINTDMFLGVLKIIYKHYSGDKSLLPKIIIMSATLDGEKYASYFEGEKIGRYTLKGKQFKLEKFYLDDLLSLKCHMKALQKKTVQTAGAKDFLDDT